ncbi:MAG: glycosyltransferase family 4 protein [Rhodobacteraceae bacterium]|nr:glycosyltransferase family 4 protein [Paracoccaceae bacterium]
MAAILLDISRTISRAPYPFPTGIDRVERAYIRHFMAQDTPVWFLSRVLKGYVLLDLAAMQQIWPMITGETQWQKNDLIARFFSRRLPPAVNRAESTLRRLSLAFTVRAGLESMLAKHLPSGFSYLNVGHSNRKPPLWRAVRAAGAKNMLAMVHDVIPLDYPEYTRPDTAARFEAEMKATATACDALIYNSNDTTERSGKWLEKWGFSPESLPILLGVDPLPKPAVSPLARPPEFIILGTIEPRKNHRLLLDIWPDIPAKLHIVGQRGWRNEAVFSTLDTSPLMGKTVFEHSDLDDAALAHRLSTARALLFPSFAEGFGYPLIEALQMGLPVICADLPCFREIAGDLPTYLSPDDPDSWKAAIRAACNSPREKGLENHGFPTWEQHFAKLGMFLYKRNNTHDQQAGK